MKKEFYIFTKETLESYLTFPQNVNLHIYIDRSILNKPFLMAVERNNVLITNCNKVMNLHFQHNLLDKDILGASDTVADKIANSVTYTAFNPHPTSTLVATSAIENTPDDETIRVLCISKKFPSKHTLDTDLSLEEGLIKLTQDIHGKMNLLTSEEVTFTEVTETGNFTILTIDNTELNCEAESALLHFLEDQETLEWLLANHSGEHTPLLREYLEEYAISFQETNYVPGKSSGVSKMTIEDLKKLASFNWV